MIQLECGNVLLKPSHKRQFLSHLRRLIKIGERIGNFVLRITLRRTGRATEAQVLVQDAAGEAALRCRGQSLRDALRQIVRELRALMQKHRIVAAG
ncbi:MAG TPA: hypothetical protein PKB10_00420 [Tepidisphaeraceae bacterium]|nr:hypothetical protein [Tepidisphaeraceae bacterium]